MTHQNPLFVHCIYLPCLQSSNRLANGKDPDDKMSLKEKMLAGAFSALPATVLTSPVERVKCLLQIQGEEVHSFLAVT